MRVFLILLMLANSFYSMAQSSLSSSTMQVHALRLKPGQDLKIELQKFVTEHKIAASCILTCVGSLQKATLRLANQSDYTTYEQKMEIVSLVGTIATEGSHIHISLSDSTGTTIGGHLVEGCTIYTTAEIVIGVLPDYRFSREHDEASGYKELKIYSKKSNKK